MGIKKRKEGKKKGPPNEGTCNVKYFFFAKMSTVDTDRVHLRGRKKNKNIIRVYPVHGTVITCLLTCLSEMGSGKREKGGRRKKKEREERNLGKAI